MSVLGFDIGNENCVIAAVKQRGIDVLLNDESKRETPAMVSFGEKQRFLGSAAAACATMNPKSTISQVKRLIGRMYVHPDVQKDLKSFPYETSEARDGSIQIHLQYLGEKHTFTPVQILAMLFMHLKETAEKNLETHVSDCVIGIPSYFTDSQRHLYLSAATIAGLKPLRLMHDCTATALGYGIYKTDFSSSGSSCVVFVDIGHSDTQVAVVRFERGHMKILAHAFDSSLGARDFDEVLFNHFAVQFKDQYDIDVYSNTRACIRLRAACEKLKKVLSANPEAPVHIECLMEEKDVKGFIKRDEFETLSADLLERIIVPCQKALKDSSLTAEKIQSVELVGSGSRIPAISRILASFFTKEPRRTLNASECVARGCALQGAMLSPIFRVKDYEVEDSLPFSIGFRFHGVGAMQTLPDSVTFAKGHRIPSDKVLTLYRSSSFQMEAFYSDEKELPPGVSPQISLFVSGPLPPHETENAKIKVKARITLHGTVTIASACLVAFMDEARRPTADMSGERHGFESDHGSSDAGNGVEDRYSKQPKRGSSFYSHERKGRVMSRCELQVNEVIRGGLSEEEFLEAQEIELQLARQDHAVEQAKEKKNTLESYVYEMRNKIFSAYRPFATDSEKDSISAKLQQTEDWLYEDGEDESADVYAKSLQDLKKLVDPIENRCKDEEFRLQASRTLLEIVVHCQKEANSLPASQKEAVLAECAKLKQWLQEKTQEQEALPKNVDPVLWSSDINKEVEAFRMRYDHIWRSMGNPPVSDGDAEPWNKGDDEMQVD